MEVSKLLREDSFRFSFAFTREKNIWALVSMGLKA